VVVERDADEVVDGGVDEPEAVPLAFCHLDLAVGSAAVRVFVGAVDEDVIRIRRWSLVLQVLACDGVDLECRWIVPLLDRVHTEILVVVCRGGSIEDHGPEYAISVLRREVRMVPGCAELSDLERIGGSITRCNSTLCDAVHAVRARAMVLAYTVPVYACPVVRHRVLDIDDQLIAPRGSDSRTWELSVDQEADTTTVSIRIASGVGDLEVVCHSFAGGRELLVKIRRYAVAILPT
jgi:hypothetical protein